MYYFTAETCTYFNAHFQEFLYYQSSYFGKRG